MPRRKFDRNFKLAAVKLVVIEELSVVQVAKELDIHCNSLYRWIREYEDYGESAFPGSGCALYNYQYEINKLKRENKYLQEELELFKKFRAFLKKKNV
jgi:Transposase and inactivated derivatives